MANAILDSTAASQTTSGISSPQFQTRSRTQSVSSDRPSTIMSVGLMSPPLSVTPDAAFIAASAASQIVTNDHDSHADTWYDQHGIEPAGETAMVSTSALHLVNGFLDQLLFNFLSTSRATTLAALRPAVSEVLKPKLAKDAINQADEELREYLGGADEDDFAQSQTSDTKDWDLELVWKRTRLRCMVYSSLGDMEEEDEDYYMEQENLKPGIDERGPEVISPAVAIFLTSILEYMGEQALVIAGQAAYHRLRAKFEKEPKEGAKSIADIADRIVVEELDMERVALDRTLGRLWRAWKKRLRSPTLDPRPFSRASSAQHKQSNAVENCESPLPAKGLGIEEAPREEPEVEQVENRVEASAIPLPIGKRDIDEIEVPGLACYSDEEESDFDEEEETAARRPKSLMIFTSHPSNDLPTPTMSQPHTPTAPSGRKRSSSLPTPSTSPYTSPVLKRAKIDLIQTELVDQQAGSDKKEISNEAIPADLQSATDKSQAQLGAVKPVQKSVKAEAETALEPKPRNPNRVSQIGISATAVAAATVAGVASAATRNTPEFKPEPAEEESGDIDEFTEEPEICTSSRVSIAGRSSPSNSESGKPGVVAPKLLQRTPSVHSARVVDVHGPKSPVAGSRASSVDASDRSRPVSLSRASSVSRSTPPIIEEKQKPKPVEIDTIIRSSSSTPRTRSPVEKLSRRQNTSESISEVDEEDEARLTRQERSRAATVASTPTLNAGTTDPGSSQTLSRSARQPGPSRHDHTQSAATKVTILSNTHTTGAIAEDRVPSPHNRSHTTATPTVLERNSGLAAHGTHSPAASIGVVALERPAAGHDSPDRTRQLRTSGSSGSSSTNKIRAVRTSEDTKAPGRVDNLARNFEELIQSDQTIQYTLTPESMRDLGANRAQSASPVVGPKSRRSEDARTIMNGERKRSVSGLDIRRTVSVSRATGLNSHPPEVKPKGFIPRAPPSTTLTRSKTGGPQARDARVPRDTAMNDFADFIRSTGPTADNGPAPLRNVSGPAPPVKSSHDSRHVSSTNRPRLQARDAAVDNREDNSDLIDFIRRGPPNANNPRIPRTVAPFRTTMDSDQMSGAVGGKAIDASLPDIRYSQASTNITDITQPSVQSSINSQSALLQNRSNSNAFDDDEDMMPKRTRRRVRDPYAIDLSDEDEEDYAQAVRPPPKKEESLADFLKNYSPPPEPASVSQNTPKRKASAPSLIGRFSRKDSNAGSNIAKPDNRSSGSRTGGHGHVPIQVNTSSGQDKYAGGGDASANRSAMHSSAGRVPMKRFEPREAVSSTTRTNDLATFLRSSEPPQMTPAARSNTSVEPQQQSSSSSSGFSKMFGRRKKSSLA
ncbi:hypothetical protein CH63R_09313 [Colletotrichum higginsianum IMI 349063]|uniref:Flo11 n=2 Tax=Colletotrichum higginsianum TaxID=80884 RepID=A0A1B7Y6W9_COLHI|nr:hypothetical protein CH63R_09313 [Colletotrichum higginsianum IMI 349063]OBR07792.1 hypothetical protein CH63R_09313 [Colletotrichum higginsianum IMI 349063]TIC91626.1 hypothetical protein CH35J_010699 [Colletotrichum higginsianum]